MTVNEFINIGVVVVLIGVLGGFVYYLFKLRRDFYAACRETDNLALFAECPMGLPVGTVRSTLALVIILFAVGYIVVSDVQEIPQSLTAIVGTVLGFYFGSRSTRDAQTDVATMVRRQIRGSAGGSETENQADAEDEGAPEPAASKTDASAHRAAAEAAPGTQDVASVRAQVREAQAITSAAVRVLPRSAREEARSLVQALDGGADAVRSLSDNGRTGEALQTGRALLDRFHRENPLRATAARARHTFGPVLGKAADPLPLIDVLARVAAATDEDTQESWTARVLHLPLPPSAIDADDVAAETGAAWIDATPALRDAFQPELDSDATTALADAARDLLRARDLESAWATYGDRFEARQPFEEGVEALRRAALDRSLREALDAALFRPVGGYAQAVAAIDALHGDDAARADLDALVMMIDALRDAGDVRASVRELVRTVRSQLEAAPAVP